jgi:hypothetical protein
MFWVGKICNFTIIQRVAELYSCINVDNITNCQIPHFCGPAIIFWASLQM